MNEFGCDDHSFSLTSPRFAKLKQGKYIIGLRPENGRNNEKLCRIKAYKLMMATMHLHGVLLACCGSPPHRLSNKSVRRIQHRTKTSPPSRPAACVLTLGLSRPVDPGEASTAFSCCSPEHGPRFGPSNTSKERDKAPGPRRRDRTARRRGPRGRAGPPPF